MKIFYTYQKMDEIENKFWVIGKIEGKVVQVVGSHYSRIKAFKLAKKMNEDQGE
ncbi:hypothetical protein J7E63_15865 [Bacillus sp. ISL-75]|uniref:hypothetical protein n=1 Tax=Bacillus sp. ISL-75 TaxID=2819137 RepID=UPI001BE992AB|nr:hypothetical protein [Bacillus sp. ISL-75]MBT2728406.1 hypothetical protein [Bacillus sp. ISL-75]